MWNWKNWEKKTWECGVIWHQQHPRDCQEQPRRQQAMCSQKDVGTLLCQKCQRKCYLHSCLDFTNCSHCYLQCRYCKLPDVECYWLCFGYTYFLHCTKRNWIKSIQLRIVRLDWTYGYSYRLDELVNGLFSEEDKLIELMRYLHLNINLFSDYVD